MPSSVRARRLACATLLLACVHPADAEPLTIDLRGALARARAHAPEAVAALARVGEAGARRTGAEVLLTQPAELHIGAGQRHGATRSLVIQGQLTQPLELARRGPRIDVADAEVQHVQALTDAALRELDFEVATVFHEARFADLTVELAQRHLDAATRVAEAGDRRRRAGEISDLDSHLTKIALGRARSALETARSERARAIGRLGALIGAQPDEVVTLAGELGAAPLTLDQLRAAVPARADVRAIEAEARVARAEGALATASGRPDLGLSLGYELDDGDTILLGGVSLTLPLWNRLQGDRAAARAKLRRAERERAATVIAVGRHVVDAFEAYARARDALDIFERDVVPVIADSERLLERSLETRQIAVSDYLATRQDILNSRREHLERQLQLARAAASARFIAGVAP
jgi:outer membrane protein, heavy metal efflux system